ncbi:MAG: hypothetical protein ACK4VI_05275 [Alphaproteobacteria bacterium]
MMRNTTLKSFLPLLLILVLAGCHNYVVRPSAVPSGYSYHNDLYKSPPSPDPTAIGYTYSAEKNEHVIEGMRDRALQLFSQIEQDADLAGSTLYIANARNHNGQNSTFDHALREVVRERGYRIASEPNEDTSVLVYSIDEPQKLRKHIDFGNLNDDYNQGRYHRRYSEFENMIIVLDLIAGEDVTTSARGVYHIPMYGYRRGNDSPFQSRRATAFEHNR